MGSVEEKVRKIGVLGATGGVGSAFVKFALNRGHDVRAMCRTPSKMSEHANLEVIKGDSVSAEDVAKLVDGVDCVVCAVGNEKHRIMEKTAANILAANPKRVIFITSLGMGGSSPTIRTILGLIVGFAQIHDCEAADTLIRGATCPWTVVRPTALSTEPGVGKYLATEKGGIGIRTLSKEDVALFMADSIEDTEWIGKAVQLYPV